MTKTQAWEIIKLEAMDEFKGPPEMLHKALDTVQRGGEMKCNECKWWKTWNRKHTSSAECRALPPAVLDNTTTAGNTYSYKYPLTAPNDCCSLFTAEPTK